MLLACNAMLWTSFICAVILSLIYYHLGRRLLLITWLAISLAGTYSLKLYLTTVRLYLPPAAFAPTVWTGPIVLFNMFWVISYNMALVLVSVHIGAIIKFGAAYDHRRYQPWMVLGGSLFGLLQIFHYLMEMKEAIWSLDFLPFAWINLIALILGLLITPPILVYLIYRFARCREASLECMKQSAISQSLCYRLLFALTAATVLTGNSILTMLISNYRQTGDRFGPFYPFHATADQLAHRYLSATFIGLVVFIIFASSDESISMLWKLRRHVRRRVFALLARGCSPMDSVSSSGSVPSGNTSGQLRKLSLPSTYDNLPDLLEQDDFEEEEGFRDRIARYARRQVEGSLASASTIHPPPSCSSAADMVILDMPAQKRERRQTLPYIAIPRSSALRIHSTVPEEIIVGSYKGPTGLMRSNSAINFFAFLILGARVLNEVCEDRGVSWTIRSLFRQAMAMKRVHQGAGPEGYEQWSKEELIKRIQVLESTTSKKIPPIEKRERPFDFDAYPYKQVAIKFAYLGWNYYGFASQTSHKPEKQTSASTLPFLPTVEDCMFGALEKCKLIRDRFTCNYSRCGRTDAGVSAASQVISIRVRSSASKLGEEGADRWHDIRHFLNRVLPRDIQVSSVTEVPGDFNARFDCRYREYRYFFPKGAYDIPLMQEAASLLVGTHDFRNFCKRDPSKEIENYVRTILKAEVKPVVTSSDDPKCMYEFVIRGTAFLYHQVRCTMAILFLIGLRQEPIDLIVKLLDPAVERPRLQMASEIPLILWDCGYDIQLNNPTADPKSKRLFWEQWREAAIKAEMLASLCGHVDPIDCIDRNVNQPLTKSG